MLIHGIPAMKVIPSAEIGARRAVQTLLTVRDAGGPDRAASLTGRGVQWLRDVG